MQLEKLLNARIASRIRFLCPDGNDTLKQNKLKEYRKYFDSSVHKWTELQIYLEFLRKYYPELPAVSSASKGELDLYDAAALGLIRQRILLKKTEDEFSQLIIDEAHVTNVAVHPDFRRRGYGEKILRALMDLARDTCMGLITLEVRRSNEAAQALYHKAGFLDVGYRKRYYEDNKEDALIMYCQL